MLSSDLVVLFDVDNTLLDNDRFSADLDAHLRQVLGEAGRERYRKHYEQLRDQRGFADYLAAIFPEDISRRPTLVPGDFSIEITEWQVPTLGQRSRDPAEAPDGSIWWTGMWASLAGRLDPETGMMEEFKLPPTSRPHTIVPDSDGNIWYTGNSNATVGYLDPATRSAREWERQRRQQSSGF